MFKNQLKFFVRIFLKDKSYSILNILGLSLGISVSMLLLLILQNDLSYDKYNVKSSQIYRLGGHLQATGLDFKGARSARELGKILKEEFPEVQNYVRLNGWDRTLIKYKPAVGDELSFYEEHLFRADSSLFSIFTYPFVSGNPATALKEPHSVVLTATTAKKYFGDQDPMNKTLMIGDETFNVTGVIKDVPENSHIKFNILLSQFPDRDWAIKNGELQSEAFWNPDVYLYLLLPANYSAKDFDAKFPKIYDKYFKSFGDKVGGKYTAVLEPLESIHFHSDLQGDEPHGNIAYLYAFTGIGVLIILLACINYMNLATAKAVSRAGEIAMKKTLGSGKRTLVISFLGESLFLAVMALLLAVGIVFFVINATPFNSLIEKNLSVDFLHNPLLLFGSVSITLFIGIVSGLYPAFYLPSIPTLQALKGAFKNQKSSLILRKVLITTQFGISIFVVACTLLMRDQINFVRSRELGFDKENTVILPVQDTLVEKQLQGIKSEFLRNTGIIGATTAYNVAGNNLGGHAVMWAESPTGMKQQSFTIMNVGDDYIKTMGMEIVQGRDFHTGPSDADQIFIANEAAAKLMGWGKDAVGKKVKFFHSEKDGSVVGVVKDFNFQSLHNKVEPLLMVKSGKEGGYLHLKLGGGNIPQTLAMIKKKWAQMDPNHPFEYFFLDQKFNEQYHADEVQNTLLTNLSYVCIFISLLGLVGLSAFNAAQRTKEIGVRKVLGASVPSIMVMLSKDVLYLVLLAGVVVVPVSYWVINGWMQNFAYQTQLNFLLFLMITIASMCLVMITVSIYSWKTATTNPVESLKYE